MSDSLQHQIALTLVPQVGAMTAKNLVSYCGSAEAVFKAKRSDLLKIPGIGPATADFLQAAEPLTLAEREMAFLEQHGVAALFYTDAHYPARLRQCHDCPALIFFKGSAPDLFDAPRVVAIVGTRQPSEHGKAICDEIVEGLQTYNVLIISGLAYGVDIAAHRKATSLGIPNVGVLGHGLSRIYPAQHRSVALKMLENGGLLSEYAHDANPDREHFPMRNRIISGLCDALIVVETAASGGSMITADLATQHQREIFAVPGRPHDAKSEGCNLLLKTSRAKLLESAADLAAALNWGDPTKPKATQTQLFLDLDPAARTVLDIVRDRPEIPIDQLTIAAQMPPGQLASLLLGLEFKNLIRTLPGKRYIVAG